MYKKIYIENFRCFRKLVLDDLQNFNLIIGKNNVGKTALLEAIFLHLGTHSPDITFKIDQFRGINSYELKAESVWAPLFTDLETNNMIMIKSWDELNRTASSEISIVSKKSAKLNPRVSRKLDQSTEFGQSLDRLKLSFNDQKRGSVNAFAIVDYGAPDGSAFKYERSNDIDSRKGMFISTHAPRSFEQEASRYSKLQIIGREQLIIDALTSIEPRIKKLIVVPILDKSAIYADIGLKKAIAVNYLGEGVVRLLQILLAMAETEDGTVLIDEIERGFHYKFYESFMKIILEFAKKLNIQIIASTHNKEFLDATSYVFETNPEDELNVIRLDKSKEEIKATYYSKSELKLMREDGWEIR